MYYDIQEKMLETASLTAHAMRASLTSKEKVLRIEIYWPLDRQGLTDRLDSIACCASMKVTIALVVVELRLG